MSPAPAGRRQRTKQGMIERIGVIGAGQMGNGIAHVCALAGLQVRLIDLDQDRMDAAL